LPFFLDHYSFCDRIVICDRGSTDRSLEILKKNDKVEIFYEPCDYVDEFSLLNLKNNAYKRYQDKYFDWQIVCDIDEFLYHPDLIGFLKKEKEKSVTLIDTIGYGMIGNGDLVEGIPLIHQITNGWRSKMFNKNVIFDPKRITDIRYTPGSHSCIPKGEVIRDKCKNLILLHFDMINYDSFVEKCKDRFSRRSALNVKYGLSTHYGQYQNMRRETYEGTYNKSKPVILNEKSIVKQTKQRDRKK